MGPVPLCRATTMKSEEERHPNLFKWIVWMTRLPAHNGWRKKKSIWSASFSSKYDVCPFCEGTFENKYLLIVYATNCSNWVSKISRRGCYSSVRIAIIDLSFQLPVVAWSAAVADGKVNKSGTITLDPVIHDFTCGNEKMNQRLLI